MNSPTRRLRRQESLEDSIQVLRTPIRHVLKELAHESLVIRSKSLSDLYTRSDFVALLLCTVEWPACHHRVSHSYINRFRPLTFVILLSLPSGLSRGSRQLFSPISVLNPLLAYLIVAGLFPFPIIIISRRCINYSALRYLLAL
jgi:hypothetical protein